jgi:3-isopropylmalate/(R)-2-methylmalate dehydratase small subunit
LNANARGSTVNRIASVTGRGLPLRGNDIDTDRIIPGRFLVTVTFDGLEQHVFEDDRKKAIAPYNRHPFDVSHFQGASILVVNSNFGCGSSREHAPQALYRWGVRAVIGESFAEIFYGNSVMIGMPCVTASAEDVAAIQERVERNPQVLIRLDLASGACDVDGFRCPVAMPPKFRDAFLTGAWDSTGLLLEHYEQVDATAAQLPYVGGFSRD